MDPIADRMLAAARQGSNKAWAALIERADPECRRLAHLVLGGHGVDQTLLSAYVRAYRARRKGPTDAVVFLTNHVWIACGHEIRRHQRREAPAPGRRPIRTDRRPRLGADALGQAVSGLRPEERAVWSLVDQAGFPIAAVALALGVDPKVVTTVASRVARQIDEALEDPTGDMAILGAEDERPDLGEPGADTSAVLVTEPSTAEAPGADETEPPIEATDAGQLDPDPPDPAFWRELGRRLRDEREAPRAAPPPALPEPGDPSPSLAAAKAPPIAMQKRAPKKIRRRRPDVVEELASEADRQRPRRQWASLLVKAAAIVVVLGVLGAAFTALYLAASQAESPVQGETVAEVAGRSMDALAGASHWSANIERSSLDEEGELTQASLRLFVRSDGSYRVQDDTIGRITTYDASALSLQDVLPGFPPRSEINVPLGGVDGGPPRDGMPLDDLAIAARTLATVDDEAPSEGKLNGRQIYRLQGALTEDITLTYTIDASDYLPVRITWTKGEETVRELRFADVERDGLEGEYTQEIADAPQATDKGFAPVDIAEVATRTDIAPLTPEFLPDGFVLSGVAVNERSRISILRYARGPQELLITLRPSPVEAGAVWDDPFTRPDDQEVTPTEVAISGGPFQGVAALQVSGPQALPSLWAADGELALTVSGDVTGDQLVAIALSLRTS